jgi:hypothetical protein
MWKHIISQYYITYQSNVDPIGIWLSKIGQINYFAK